jgi:hypothetical protein
LGWRRERLIVEIAPAPTIYEQLNARLQRLERLKIQESWIKL